MPASAQQSSNEVRQQCETALNNAENLLVNNRHLWIVDTRTSPVEYESYPYQRSFALAIVMQGNAVEDVMNSSQLLATISQSILQSCPTVGLVTFGESETDWLRTFGWIGNRAREFECRDPGEATSWGYMTCI